MAFLFILTATLVSVAAAASSPASPLEHPIPERIRADLASHLQSNRHPRILVSESDFARVAGLRVTDPLVREWCEALRKKADGMLRAPSVTYGLSSYSGVLPQARRLLSYAQVLGLTYRLTGDHRYADRLWQEIETVCDRTKFPDWGKTHYNDAVEMGTAFAIAYDWLYDRWSDSQRAMMRQHLREFVLKYVVEKLTNESMPENGKTLTNIRLVYAGGAAVSALAILDEADSAELAARVISASLRALERGVALFAPDGGWYEGARYWGYAVRYHNYLLASLQCSVGTTYGLIDAPGFRETGSFPIQMAGPCGNFNFHDDYPDPKIDSELSWLGRQFDVNFGRRRCEELRANRVPPEVVDVLYYRPEFSAAPSVFPKTAFYRAAGTAVFRTGWSDNAWFLGVHVGPNIGAHAQLDMGTFILDAQGQRWVSDVGGGSYDWKGYLNSPEFHLWNEPANLRPGRFDYYCNRAEGHNTLVVGTDRLDFDQNLRAESRILNYTTSDRESRLVADLTSAYAPRATAVRRGFAFQAEPPVVMVRDEIEAASETQVTWAFHTLADVQISPDQHSAILSIDGKHLTVRITSQANLALTLLPVPPEPEPKQTKLPSPRGGANTYDRLKKVGFVGRGHSLAWSVTFTPESSENAAPAVAARPLAEW
jgi:hypothetical protein